MSVRLVKTIGGSNGSPQKCKGCGSVHFIKSGQAWSCGSCGLYFPVTLKQDLEHLEKLHKALRKGIDKLEELVKE